MLMYKNFIDHIAACRIMSMYKNVIDHISVCRIVSIYKNFIVVINLFLKFSVIYEDGTCGVLFPLSRHYVN